jgi:acetoacetyl-CoA synthetase
MRSIREGELLWAPSEERVRASNLARYTAWLKAKNGKEFADYQELWMWSVSDLDAFWTSIWDYFGVGTLSHPSSALVEPRMPGAEWFPGAELNYAERALAAEATKPAVVHMSEVRPMSTVTYEELRDQVARAAAGLRRLGVARGDRVVSTMPNIVETLVAFLATASLGAVWSSVSPDFGVPSALDRFKQIEPTVLFAVDGYNYAGNSFDCTTTTDQIRSNLSSLKKTVIVASVAPAHQPSPGSEDCISWEELLAEESPLTFEPVPFNHPLWILYSSGTTGLPKGIVHGHGGILLEHLKSHALHLDLGPDDRFFWFSTTGWMMWNFLIGGLLRGCTILLFDGHPMYPDPMAMWRFIDEAGVTFFGTSAPYIETCMRSALKPGKEVALDALRSLGSTASPLSAEGFRWVYEEVKSDLLLGSASGGTDVCSAFVGSCPVLPVKAGEIQCRLLGARVEAFDHRGESVTDEVGELVVAAPMPSMPLYFWNDPGKSRYIESYFDTYPGVWRHGDWIKITGSGACIIYGRSDSTIKRGGVRTGTSEFYRLVEGLPEIEDSLVVDVESLDPGARLLLFVKLIAGVSWSDALETKTKSVIRGGLSPRHVPDAIYVVPDIPRTLNGKKLEVPIKRILSGAPAEKVVAFDSVSNPASIASFVALAGEPS